MSKTLATINVEGEFDYDFEQARIGNFYTEEAYVLCKQLEFKNLLGRFDKSVASVGAEASHFALLGDLAAAEEFFAKCGGLKKDTEIGLAFLREKKTGECVGAAFALAPDQVWFLPCEGLVTAAYLQERLTVLNRAGDCRFAVAGIKGSYDMLE